MDSEDEMVAEMVEDSNDDEELYACEDDEDDSDQDDVIMEYDGFMDYVSDDSDELASNHHHHIRPQVIFVIHKSAFWILRFGMFFCFCMIFAMNRCDDVIYPLLIVIVQTQTLFSL